MSECNIFRNLKGIKLKRDYNISNMFSYFRLVYMCITSITPKSLQSYKWLIPPFYTWSKLKIRARIEEGETTYQGHNLARAKKPGPVSR